MRIILKVWGVLLVIFCISNIDSGKTYHIPENNMVTIIIDKNAPMQVFGTNKIETDLQKLQIKSQVNNELSKNLNMWKAFLDMIAENRLNALTLWGLHPFPYMIKAKKLRAAVALNQNKKNDAVTCISEARDNWHNLVQVTADHIQPGHLAITEDYFHWKNYQDDVDAEVDWVKQQ